MLSIGPEVNLPGALALGVVVGLVSGMFGVGGGFLLTPLLSVVFQVPMPIAIGTGLCQMVGSSTAAYLKHRQLGQGEPRFALLLIPGSLLGVLAGARVVGVLSELGTIELLGREQSVSQMSLYSVYVVFLLLVARVMWKQVASGPGGMDYVRRGPLSKIRVRPLVDLPQVPLTGVSATLIAYMGLVLGFMSGLLGISGGIVLIPTLIYGFGFPFRQAAGTGIVVTLLTSVVGTIAHARAAHIALPLALVLLMGSTVSAQVGAVITSRAPARKLRRALACVVLLTVVLVVFDLLRLLVG